MSAPRTWTMDAPPGPDVTAVRDRFNVRWRRDPGTPDLWWGDIGHSATVGDESFPYEDCKSWSELLGRGPLTDASGEAS